jgi:hypothetical protein
MEQVSKSSMVYYQNYLQIGNELFMRGDLETARRQYMNAVFARENSDPPLNHVFYVRLAACQRFMGNVLGAVRCDEIADKIAGDNEVKRLRVGLERLKAEPMVLAGMPTESGLQPAGSYPGEGSIEDTLVESRNGSVYKDIGRVAAKLPDADIAVGGWPISPAPGTV